MDLGLQASLQLLSVFVAFPCIVVRVQRGVDRSGGHHRVGIGLVGAEEGFSQSGLACLGSFCPFHVQCGSVVATLAAFCPPIPSGGVLFHKTQP